MDSLGLYIHFPFCRKKCNYCDFYSIAAEDEQIAAYTEAVLADIHRQAGTFRNQRFDTLFVGGGTPTVGGRALVRIVSAALAEFFFEANTEATAEANPESVSLALLRDLRAAGINRISLGAQSFCDGQLSDMDRLHDRTRIFSACEDIRTAGFENFNLDVMMGVGRRVGADGCANYSKDGGQSDLRRHWCGRQDLNPRTAQRFSTQDNEIVRGEGVYSDVDGTPAQKEQLRHEAAFEETLSGLLEIKPPHISAYSLKIAENTPLFSRRETFLFPDEDYEEQQYARLCGALGAQGYGHYEISNFARTGFECRHNLKYWTGGQYLGLGAAAHSFIGGRRYHNRPDIAGYIAGIDISVTDEVLDDRAAVYERLVMGLRLRQGICFTDMRDWFDVPALQARLQKLSDAGLAMVEPDRFYLTERGFRVSNSVINHLSDCMIIKDNKDTGE